jgi:catalase-peroxidase
LVKVHGAADPEKYVGPSATVELDLVGKNSFRTGKGEDTISSGLEGAWCYAYKVDNYFENLFGLNGLTKSPRCTSVAT